MLDRIDLTRMTGHSTAPIRDAARRYALLRNSHRILSLIIPLVVIMPIQATSLPHGVSVDEGT